MFSSAFQTQPHMCVHTHINKNKTLIWCISDRSSWSTKQVSTVKSEWSSLVDIVRGALSFYFFCKLEGFLRNILVINTSFSLFMIPKNFPGMLLNAPETMLVLEPAKIINLWPSHLSFLLLELRIKSVSCPPKTFLFLTRDNNTLFTAVCLQQLLPYSEDSSLVEQFEPGVFFMQTHEQYPLQGRSTNSFWLPRRLVSIAPEHSQMNLCTGPWHWVQTVLEPSWGAWCLTELAWYCPC